MRLTRLLNADLTRSIAAVVLSTESGKKTRGCEQQNRKAHERGELYIGQEKAKRNREAERGREGVGEGGEVRTCCL